MGEKKALQQSNVNLTKEKKELKNQVKKIQDQLESTIMDNVSIQNKELGNQVQKLHDELEKIKIDQSTTIDTSTIQKKELEDQIQKLQENFLKVCDVANVLDTQKIKLEEE